MTKARDVARVIARRGAEQGCVMLLTELFERQAAQEQRTMELARQLLLMAELLDQTASGTVAIRQQVERMQRGIRQEDSEDLPPSAH